MDGPNYSLKALSSLDFLAIGQLISSQRGLATVLRTRDDLRHIRKRIACGAITPAQIQAFVQDIFSDLTPGATSVYDVTLAALAIAMESQPGPFAERFLESLTELRAVEFPRSPEIGKESLAIRRRRFAKSTVERRQFSVQNHTVVELRYFVATRQVSSNTAATVGHWKFAHEVA